MRSVLDTITPATDWNLVTLDRFKRELAITDDSDDETISDHIAEASSTITLHCNRSFAFETYRETFWLDRERDLWHGPGWHGRWDWDTTSAPFLPLARIPVTSVLSVVADGHTLPSGHYLLDSEVGQLFHLWPDGRQASWWAFLNIVVEYQAGYLLPGQKGRTLPPTLEAAALLLAKSTWIGRADDPRLRAISVPGVLDKQFWVGPTGDELPAEVEARLARFVKPATGV